MLGIGLEEIVVAVAIILAVSVPAKFPKVAKSEVKAKPSLEAYLKSTRKKG